MNNADDDWTEEVQIGEGTFRSYHNEARPIWAQLHVSEEQYRFSPEEREIVPVTALRGTRSYVHAQVFAWEPELRLTVGLWPGQPPMGLSGRWLAPNSAANAGRS